MHLAKDTSVVLKFLFFCCCCCFGVLNVGDRTTKNSHLNYNMGIFVVVQSSLIDFYFPLFQIMIV